MHEGVGGVWQEGRVVAHRVDFVSECCLGEVRPVERDAFNTVCKRLLAHSFWAGAKEGNHVRASRKTKGIRN